MISLFHKVFLFLNRLCGLESVSNFPVGHRFFRTSWNPAYFDIFYGMHPDEIERSICMAIENTPSIFACIINPTPKMQKVLLAALQKSLYCNDGNAAELAGMLINAYASPYIEESMEGLQAAIAVSSYKEIGDRVHDMVSFLASMNAPFDVIDM